MEEREMIPLCLDQGVGVIPYSPLARGLLGGSRQRRVAAADRDGPGKRVRDEQSGAGHDAATIRASSDPLADEMYDDADFDVVDVVRAVAAEQDLSPAQVSLAWLLGKPAVVAPIVGVTRPRHLAEAIAAAGITLAADTVARLEQPYRPHRVLGHGT
jgi:aryl-alcohol dehydrogenase-like predicted oxidoreductase